MQDSWSLLNHLDAIRTFAERIAYDRDNISDEEWRDLADDFRDISRGEDPKEVLGISNGRGETSAKSLIASDKRASLFAGWLAMACVPEEQGGLGLSLEKAIIKLTDELKEPFGWTEETMRTYASSYIDRRRPVFQLRD